MPTYNSIHTCNIWIIPFVGCIAKSQPFTIQYASLQLPQPRATWKIPRLLLLPPPQDTQLDYI